MKILNNRYFPHLLLLCFAFLLYGNTLTHDYALDDLMVIKGNSFTQKGLSGIGEIFSYDSFTGFFGMEKKLVAGGRYRPLSIASFAVEYSLTGGLHPSISHLINILLYALTGIVIFIVFSRLFRSLDKRGWLHGIPFTAALIFMALPIHTEVVANIKGRDEIMALLFPMLALNFTLVFLEKKKAMWLILANLFFFAGLLSKENAILFTLLIPVTVWYFTKADKKRIAAIAGTLAFTAAAFVFIRFLVLGYLNSGGTTRELLNNPFLEATASQKYGTILYTLGLYIKLLFFPYPLTHDYYPYHIPLVPLSDWKALLSLAIYLFLIVLVILRYRSKDLISYGILFYLSTLFIVSNLLFPVGTFMNERFIYMPSLGFALVISFLMTQKLYNAVGPRYKPQRLVAGLLVCILAVFTVTTIARNPVWKDDFTLFTTDVKVSSNSIKCNISAGGDLQKKAGLETDSVKKTEYYAQSEMYLEKALSIYPKAINGLVLYGNVLTLYKKDYKASIGQYLKALDLDPYNNTAYTNSIQVLGYLDNTSEISYKLRVLKYLNGINPENADVNYQIGKLYGQYKGNLDSAVFFLERSVNIAPDNVPVLKDLGIVYSMRGQYERALNTFSRAQKIDPNDQQIRQNIQLTYQFMSKQPKAQQVNR